MRRQLDDTVLGELGSIDALKKRLMARLGELDTKKSTTSTWLASRAGRRPRSRRSSSYRYRTGRDQGQLADTTTRIDTGCKFFLTALELPNDPQSSYRRGGASVKHSLTKVIFSKLYPDMRDITVLSGG